MSHRLQQSCLKSITSLALLFAGVGCACDWHSNSSKYLQAYQQGDFPNAAAESLHCAHNSVAGDALLFDIDAGSLARVNGDLGQSLTELDNADRLVGNYQEWPTVSITEETVAALTSARTVAYRGKLSDLVMLNTYRALDHMELGHANGARSMLIRAGFVQDEIASKYAQELKKTQDETQKQKQEGSKDYDANRSQQAISNDPKTQAEYKDLLNLKPYGNYVNPFCDYIRGMYFLGAALDSSDKERASTAFKRAASMEPSNGYIQQDIADAEKLANGQRLPSLTYVIFETGMAPETGQIQVPLPLFLANNQAPTVVLYFPTMKPRGDFVQSLSVMTALGTYQTQIVSDMDSVILQEFKNTLPTVIERMIISAATKAAIDAGIRQGLKGQDAFVQLGYTVASAGYQLIANQADLRSWQVLPKQFQVARFVTPADHNLVLAPGDQSGRVSVTLTDAPINVVYVKSVRRGVRIVVRNFTISSEEKKPTSQPAPIAPVALVN